MSGHVRTDRVIGRHWRALPKEQRDAIEAAIPDGHVIYIGAGYKATPGTGDVRLMRERDAGYGTRFHVEVTAARGSNLLALCWHVINAATVRAFAVDDA